jgi:hypothetical protein
MAKRIKNYHGLEGADLALSEKQRREKLVYLAEHHGLKPYMANLLWSEINLDWENTPQKTKDIVKALGL